MSWVNIGIAGASMVMSMMKPSGGGGGSGTPGSSGSESGAGGGMFSNIVPMLQTAAKAYDFASPQGPVAQGNMGGSMKSGMDLGSSVNSLFASPQAPQPQQLSGPGMPSAGATTTTAGGFGGMTPDIQQAILKLLMGK